MAEANDTLDEFFRFAANVSSTQGSVVRLSESLDRIFDIEKLIESAFTRITDAPSISVNMLNKIQMRYSKSHRTIRLARNKCSSLNELLDKLIGPTNDLTTRARNLNQGTLSTIMALSSFSIHVKSYVEKLKLKARDDQFSIDLEESVDFGSSNTRDRVYQLQAKSNFEKGQKKYEFLTTPSLSKPTTLVHKNSDKYEMQLAAEINDSSAGLSPPNSDDEGDVDYTRKMVFELPMSNNQKDESDEDKDGTSTEIVSSKKIRKQFQNELSKMSECEMEEVCLRKRVNAMLNDLENLTDELKKQYHLLKGLELNHDSTAMRKHEREELIKRTSTTVDEQAFTLIGYELLISSLSKGNVV